MKIGESGIIVLHVPPKDPTNYAHETLRMVGLDRVTPGYYRVTIEKITEKEAANDQAKIEANF